LVTRLTATIFSRMPSLFSCLLVSIFAICNPVCFA
jgi:hypothetical protein